MITEDATLKTLQKLENNMRHFQNEREILSNLFDRAKEIDDPQLAISVKTAIKGMDGILDRIVFFHDELTADHESAKVVNLDKPVLRLIVDNTKKGV